MGRRTVAVGGTEPRVEKSEAARGVPQSVEAACRGRETTFPRPLRPFRTLRQQRG
jgi:hypothetical protein